MRRTKILATLGPASAHAPVLDAMVAAGLDGARLNFSHGTREWHGRAIAMVRAASARAGRPLAVLCDLQGPRLRVGDVKDGVMQVPTGSRLVLTTRKVQGAAGVVSTEYEDLPREVAPGSRILLDEGRISLTVEAVEGEEVICRVEDGGPLSSQKGINLPGAAMKAPALTEKDREDARFALDQGVDYLALSFVRQGQDVLKLKRLLKESGKQAAIVAKIEKPEAMANLEEIVACSDGVMVARGDLGVEAPLEMIPAFQKRIIQSANQAGKLVITATQMLESMTANPTPTRAEVTDVANAILDGTDVVMLSGETAAGEHPVESVRAMAAIAVATEETLYPFSRPVSSGASAAASTEGLFTAAIARLAGHASREVDPRAIVVFTRHGRTARVLSYERPRPPVVAFTSDESVLRRMALYWGVAPRSIPLLGTSEELLRTGERLLMEGKWAGPGETALFLFGTSTSPGATNTLKIARMGEAGN